MFEPRGTTKKQKISLRQADDVLCGDCKQTMQLVEDSSISADGIVKFRCAKCKHAVELSTAVSALQPEPKRLARPDCIGTWKGFSGPPNRSQGLLVALALAGTLVLAALALNTPSLVSLALHNPQHYHLGGGPPNFRFNFEDAILYSDKCWGRGDSIEWEGVYSSLSLSSRPVEVATITGKAMDSRGIPVHTIPDVRTITGFRTVIRPASSGQLPFEDAPSPPIKPIVDGMSVISAPSNQGGIDRRIEPPPNSLVDLSSVNALILSRQHGIYNRGEVLNLGPGDYITNQLCNTTHLYSAGHEKSAVRIFVQDEPNVPRGIVLDNCRVGDSQHPANFKIWYNGTGPIRIKGRSRVACVIYAPHADLEIGPDVLFEGAMVCRNVHVEGGLIFFDTDLRKVTDWP